MLCGRIGGAQAPPKILQLSTDRLKPGSEAAYTGIEEDAARICARLKCPNPYLAIQTVTGAPEVWFLNTYESQDAQESVRQGYANNTALAAELAPIPQRKASLIFTPRNVTANYREDLSHGSKWDIGRARFFFVTTVAVRAGHSQEYEKIRMLVKPIRGDEFVYQAVSGTTEATYFLVTPSHSTRGSGAHDKDDSAMGSAVMSREKRVFTVKPSMSYPAKEWIAADPKFW